VPLDEGHAAVPAAQEPARDTAVLDEVLQAIGRLQRRQATAILLRAIHDESYETIARSLGCSEVTARVHVLHAREKLRRALSHLCRPAREEASR
jgi:RNA polymerase sigma factor (sigma-70 family)